jgi:hypothetical protein
MDAPSDFRFEFDIGKQQVEIFYFETIAGSSVAAAFQDRMEKSFVH